MFTDIIVNLRFIFYLWCIMKTWLFQKFLVILHLLIHTFFISNTKQKLAKNQAKDKQHLEAELLLSENYSLCSSTLSSKNNRRYSKNKCVGYNRIL